MKSKLGKAHKERLALEEHFLYLHNNPPLAFNPHYRPGIGAAVSEEYSKWCDEHPGSTQDERKAAYAEISDQMESKFPPIGSNL